MLVQRRLADLRGGAGQRAGNVCNLFRFLFISLWLCARRVGESGIEGEASRRLSFGGGRRGRVFVAGASKSHKHAVGAKGWAEAC